MEEPSVENMVFVTKTVTGQLHCKCIALLLMNLQDSTCTPIEFLEGSAGRSFLRV